MLDHYAPRENHATWIDRQSNARGGGGDQRGEIRRHRTPFFPTRQNTMVQWERPSYKNLSAPVSDERAALPLIFWWLNTADNAIEVDLYVRARGEENRKCLGRGKRGRRGARGGAHSLEPLFSIAVQYPNWLGQQSDWGPQRNRTAASSRKAEIPLSSSGTRLEQGDERCYRLGNIKSPLFLCRFLDACGRQTNSHVTVYLLLILSVIKKRATVKTLIPVNFRDI